jgi:hypothetical protein
MDAFPTDPLEALVAILEGARLPSLETFVAANHEEGQHLEYKDGRLLEDHEKAKKEIRAQVNGFGNSEGGLLVIGVTNTIPRKVVACSSAPGGKRPCCRPTRAAPGSGWRRPPRRRAAAPCGSRYAPAGSARAR